MRHFGLGILRVGVSIAACIAALWVSGCSGVYLSPGVNMPALERAGQTRLSASTTLFSPQTSSHGHLAVAASDVVRVGGTVSGAFDRSLRRGVYGELFAGAEPRINRFLQYGVLASAGYGRVTDSEPACEADSPAVFCAKPSHYVDHAKASYWRFAAQGHFILRAPRVVHGGAGLRVALMAMEFSEIDRQPTAQSGLPVALEPFMMVRVGWKRFQVGPEARYVAVVNGPRSNGRDLVLPDRLVLAFGITVLLGPLNDQ